MAVDLQSIMHVNVNCSELSCSLEFYETVLGLSSGSHTNPVPQDGAGFGLAGEVQWDAHILQDARGFGAPGIDLLEWKQPPPVGRPYESPACPGLARVVVEHPDLAAAARAATARGGRIAWREEELPVGEARRAAALEIADPDGTRIRLLEAAAGAGRFSGVGINCSDLARSVDWYTGVLGLEAHGGSYGFEGSAGSWRARKLSLVDPEHFHLELVEWADPKDVAGAPYASANHLGIYRMAFLVEDIRAAHARLGESGVACPDPVWLDMGPEIPIDGLWACFFPDPDGTCLELIESPKL
jgi:catechol 2,3-dioxygenase-like lactoylglutathione lyase family enzyme